MNPVLRVLKNSTALSLTVLLERAVAFFLPWYIARVQGSEVYGGYATAMTFVVIASGFAYWGLDQLLPREIARDRKRSGTFLASAGVLGGATSILTALAVSMIVHFLHYPPQVQNLIYLGIVCVLLPRTEAILCEAAINGLEKMEWIAAVRFPIAVLRIASSVFLLSQGFGLEALLIILAAYHAAMCGVYLLLFKRFAPAFRLQFDRSLMRMLAIQAVPLVMTISIGETSKQIDRVFLSKLWETESVGIYSTGIMLVQVMYMLAPAIMNALYPVLSRAYTASRERFSALVAQIFRLLFIGIFPVALTIITFADLAILLVFGQEYVPSIAVLRIYALGIVPSFVARLLYRTILASNNERLTVRIVIVNSIAILALNGLLIPRYGVLGAAVSAACTELIGLTQNLFYVSRKVIRFDFGQALLRPGVSVLVSVLAYLGIMQLNLPATQVRFLGAVQWSFPAAWAISLVVFAIALFASRAIGRQDLALVSAVRRRGAGDQE